MFSNKFQGSVEKWNLYLSIRRNKFDYKAVVNNDQSVEKTLGTAILWKTHLQNVTVNIIELCRLQSVEVCGYTFFNIYV